MRAQEAARDPLPPQRGFGPARLPAPRTPAPRGDERAVANADTRASAGALSRCLLSSPGASEGAGAGAGAGEGYRGLRELQRELESLKLSLSVYLGPGLAPSNPRPPSR